MLESDHQILGKTINLSQVFPPVPTKAWEAAIEEDLRGRDYARKLIWQTGEGISVSPYYRSDALMDLAPQIYTAPGQFPFLRGNKTDGTIGHNVTVQNDAVRADLILEAGGDSVQQLGIALAAGVDRLDRLSQNQPLDVVAPETEFVFAVGSIYFIEIAKLRAARMLWARVVEQFAPSDLNVCKMKLHARTAVLNKTYCDQHTNVLRATTEAMSAVIGGCDSLSIEPFGFDEHLAINILRIITEEAHLNKVADPAGGSYCIEALTSSLAHEAWRLFQRIESAGGYAAAINAGWLQQEIANSRVARENAIASREVTMVGVNNFPDLTAREIEGPPVLADRDSGLSPFRLAEPFEAIRKRTRRHAEKTGHIPKVLLLKRGDLEMRTARSTFSLNLLGCAGFEVAESDDYVSTDADLVVLCSSDEEYLSLVQEVCGSVPVPVLVAGNPKDRIDELQAAGVQGFIHPGINVLETLTDWQNRLGIIR